MKNHSALAALVALVALAASPVAQAASRCAFGEEIGDLERNPRFVKRADVVKTFKLSRIHRDHALIMVSITVLKDRKTGREYHMNTTFRHRDDGDNTIGWIEEVTGATNSDGGASGEGRVVAEIGDSFFDRCFVQ